MTWKDVEPTEDGVHTNFTDLWYPVLLAVFIILLRQYLERKVFRPLGLFLGIRDSKHPKPPGNDILEKEYNKTVENKLYTINTLQLSVDLNMTERQVQYWLKRKRLYGKANTMTKFCETGWRCFYYSVAFTYGAIILRNKPWLWNIQQCWYNYPHHDVPRGVWWYYMVELAFYWSLSFSQFVDVKRKDFVEMFLHHVVTISLLSFSWTCNLHRCGSLVLLVHDFADIFLELAKMCHYAKFNTACDVVFAFFTVSWIVTRLGLLPTWILYSSIMEAPQIVQMFPAYYIFNALLSVLLVLHVIWTYFILKLPYNALLTTEKKKDTRSDSSDETNSDDDNSEKAFRTDNTVDEKPMNGFVYGSNGTVQRKQL